MSTTLILGLARSPDHLYMGMDQSSTDICSVLQDEMEFPSFTRATPDAASWTSSRPGAIASVHYAADRLTALIQEITQIPARLIISFVVDKQAADIALDVIFSSARRILDRTEWDAVFCYEYDHVILRRVRGETFIEAATLDLLGEKAKRHLRHMPGIPS